jgi:hypothetical protein
VVVPAVVVGTFELARPGIFSRRGNRPRARRSSRARRLLILVPALTHATENLSQGVIKSHGFNSHLNVTHKTSGDESASLYAA